MDKFRGPEQFDASVEIHGGEPFAVWAPAVNGSHVKAELYFALLAELESKDKRIAELEAKLANREAQPVAWQETLSRVAKAFEVLLETAGNFDKEVWADMPEQLGALTAPPAPAMPDGYCVMPPTLTAANGAKGALSGEFKVSRTVRCHECGGEGCDDCGDAGEFEEETTVPWDTIKEIYRAVVDACRATMLAN